MTSSHLTENETITYECEIISWDRRACHFLFWNASYAAVISVLNPVLQVLERLGRCGRRLCHLQQQEVLNFKEMIPVRPGQEVPAAAHRWVEEEEDAEIKLLPCFSSWSVKMRLEQSDRCVRSGETAAACHVAPSSSIQLRGQTARVVFSSCLLA